MRPHFLLPDEPYATYAEYLRDHGPSAVARARTQDPSAVLDVVMRAGLRGRGGAGFPTGVKWGTVARHPCTTRTVVCNAAEGEPGTFKDRWLLRRNPYATLEGMLVAAHVVGARDLYVAIRASCRREIERVRSAIEELRAAGLLSGLAIHLVEGPEEYLFGEEKGLLRFIEEGVPLPREAHYPPYELGLFATAGSPNPAVVNNAETFAHVPGIVRLGAESFRSLGTHDTPGTVLYTVSGDVLRPGVYEREAGTSLRSLLFDVAGGPREGAIRTVLSGASNGPIPADRLDTPADFGSLALIGSGLGSAGFVVYDESRSMPRVAQAFARFLYVESCNQCTACKHGLRLASTALDEIFDPTEASPDDLERALYGARSAPQGNRCYLPQEGATLIPRLVERYREEFDAQIARPTAESAPIPVPLLADFDETKGAFVLEESFARKQPDWSYAEPAPEHVRATSTPSAAPEGSVGVRLARDVHERLTVLANERGEDLESLANRLLRERLGT